MTTQIQSIAPETLSVIAYNNIPVITTNLLAKLYSTDDVNIRMNYQRNQDRFIEGKHYYLLTGYKLKDFKNSITNSYSDEIVQKKARSLILWTERGAARHAKMLDTDQAWEVFEKLEDSYFCSSEQVILPSKTTVDQRTPLRDAVNLLVSKKALTYSEAYSVVHQRFNVASIEDLPLEQLSQAIEYVHHIALEGEYIAHEKEQTVNLSLEDIYHLTWLLKASVRLREGVETIAPALNAIGSSYHSSFLTMGMEYKYTIKEAKEVIIDKLKQLGFPSVFNGKNFPNLNS